MGRSDFGGGFNRSGAHPGHHEGNIRGGGLFRQHQIGAGPEQGRETRGRDAERTRVLAVEEVGGLIALRDIDQIARHQPFAIKGGFIARET